MQDSGIEESLYHLVQNLSSFLCICFLVGLVAVRNFCLFVVVVVKGKLWSWVVENSEQFAASWRSTNREVICVFVVIVVGFLLLLLL